jgi:hypothetical protein
MKNGFRHAINGGIAATVIFLIGTPAHSQNSPQWTACIGKDTKADARIAACTSAVQSAR